jgi:3-hydroxyacyl-CoA dehydrogenase
VIWSGDEPFSVGADLQAMLPAFMLLRRQGHRGCREKKLQT